MRTRIQIGGYEIEYDRDATAACYARVQVPGPEGCGCADCRNWVAGREHVVSSELRHFLSRFGIPINGEIEVSECPGQKMAHLYSGWYFIVGRIISGREDLNFMLGRFELSFTSGRSFAVPAFDRHQVCELHFTTETDTYVSKAEYALPPRPAHAASDES